MHFYKCACTFTIMRALLQLCVHFYKCACTFTNVRALLPIVRALLQLCVHFYKMCMHIRTYETNGTLYGQNLDCVPWVWLLNMILKALLLGAFITLSGRLVQESTTHCVKVCLRNKSQLPSLNIFKLWSSSPIELNVKNLEESSPRTRSGFLTLARYRLNPI